MSSAHVASHASHGHAHGSLKSYIVGFILSLVLTALSFGAVMTGAVSKDMIVPAITILAVIQLLVQLVFFLHLGAAPEQRNNTVIFILTVMLIATIVGGSLWVMHNANVNMMPTQMSVERALAKD
ncbi:cytochrome o ubiquinol oxidase subunit IV [Pedomonas mirosovicensis]|uniref:cytochrome o ubiquinol oxidase subunit IV n=1 Tax=Pedomonas mirosovicensis TaxID=2908641 RepID=UPI0021675382|nr:cytochrome o ubiquinol oxidase subunit IV [Pedomonas mirosovicensis]MCH8686636.1 cytochrome o ubiquinol oxidase subunit IV [Pedomonas mirosovicensis]